jgi:hypothetical protein
MTQFTRHRPSDDVTGSSSDEAVARRARDLFGRPRFTGYLQHCGDDEFAGLAFYHWDAAASAAFWEVLGHLASARTPRRVPAEAPAPMTLVLASELAESDGPPYSQWGRPWNGP